MEKNLNKLGRKAKALASDPSMVVGLARVALTKAHHFDKQLVDVREDLVLLVRLLKAWGTGRYREISWTSLLSIIAAVLYFVNPMDAIPDFLPVLGLTDDLSVIAFVLTRVKGELDRFRKWDNKPLESKIQSSQLES